MSYANCCKLYGVVDAYEDCAESSKSMGNHRAESKDEDKNNMAMALLFQSIPEALILQVGDLDSSKSVWEAIKARHVGAD